MVNPENVVKTTVNFNDKICKLLSEDKVIEAKNETDEMSRYFNSMLELASKSEKFEIIRLLEGQENKDYFSRALKGIVFVNEFTNLFEIYANTLFTESDTESKTFKESLKKDAVEILISAYYDKENTEMIDSMLDFMVNILKELECIKLVNKLKKSEIV